MAGFRFFLLKKINASLNLHDAFIVFLPTFPVLEPEGTE